MATPRSDEWMGYYDEFEYFTAEGVRDGCHPRIMLHPTPAERAVVLVHGLSDSPHFVSAIARHFHEQLGHDVYAPLLHCHGLKDPKGMELVDLGEWKRNVRFAIKAAQERSARVSIGGLSTGGALALFMAATKPAIDDAVYLFSAALDLAGGRTGLLGEVKERLLRTFLADVLDQNQPLIGPNPYRYGHVDLDGAQELARLIEEIDDLLDGYSEKRPFPKRVFAAHSESDTTADIAGIEALQRVARPEAFEFYRIPESAGVAHASLVLERPVPETGEVLEEANPRFADMMAALTAFA